MFTFRTRDLTSFAIACVCICAAGVLTRHLGIAASLNTVFHLIFHIFIPNDLFLLRTETMTYLPQRELKQEEEEEEEGGVVDGGEMKRMDQMGGERRC